MTLPTLTHLSNTELFSGTQNLRRTEREARADIVLHLAEIDKRGIYRDEGYSSLFAYCTVALGYSEGEAFRRISAARCLKDHPEVYEKLKQGSLSLCAVAELSKVVTTENKEQLFSASEGRSRRDVQKIVSVLKAPVALKRERVRVMAVAKEVPLTLFDGSPSPAKVGPPEPQFSVQFQADSEFMRLFEEVKSLMGGVSSMQFETKYTCGT